MDNVSSNKDDHVHSNPIEWIIEGEFKVEYIEKAPIKVKSVYFNKNCWSMTGTIYDGKLKIIVSNGGEYRSEFSYDYDQPLILSDIDYVRLSVYHVTPDQDLLIYSNLHYSNLH